MFQGIGAFHPSFSFRSIFCSMSVVCVVSFLFLVLFICVIFFSWSVWLKVYQFYCLFSENYIFSVTDFFLYCFSVFYFFYFFVVVKSLKLCQALCNLMDCSTPGFPVFYDLPEFAQIHVHSIGDAIQPSHPLLPASPPALNLSQHQIFSNESALCIRRPQYWSLSISPSNEYSGLISFRIDWFDLLGVQGALKSLGQFESITIRTKIQKHQFFGAQPSL